MQEPTLETELSSTFPPPPQHYKLFTEENMLAFKEKRYDAIRDTIHTSVYDKTNTDGYYQCFHERWKVYIKNRSIGVLKYLKIQYELPSLADFGIQQLFKTDNGPLCAQERINELKKMLRSLLLNFLELTGIMGIAPEEVYTCINCFI